ncbi:MAG: SLBB domain-containing protein [Myxacorys chilensis ATA2-1-KO14]|jgi:polysaccharide export outer membrane protein|nr:SLBB domain-containing protein [Myxacorys chilensis ATA2-1-KO14]
MKLKLTPTNISLLAISAFGALVAQELIRTEAQTPTPTGDKFKRKQSNLAARAAANPAALAQPELGGQESLSSAVRSTPPQPRSVSVPKTPDLKASDLAIAELPPPPPSLKASLPAPPRVKDTPIRIKSVGVDQLPIDSIVAASLSSGMPSKSNFAAAEQQSKTKVQSKEIQSKETEAEASEAAFTPASSKNDLEGHRAQPAIQALMQRGIVQTGSDGNFRPDASVSDQQFSSMMQKASSKAAIPIGQIQRPKDIVTQADAATFVYRQLQKAEASKSISAAPVAAQTSTAPLPQLASADLSGLNATPAFSQSIPSVSPSPAAPESRALPPAKTPTEAPRSQVVRVAAAANVDAYTLGAGDRIKVDVFNVGEYSKEYQVLVNGTLNLYRVGNLSVTGMTLKQAERAIAAKYARVLKRPMIDVSLAAARPLNVAIAGEVGRPGSYALDLKDGKFPTVTKLIQEAGGMTRSANPRQVIVRRPQLGGVDREIAVDLWELFQTGNIRQDLTLLDGDTIFIPTSNGVNLAESAQFAAANFATDSAKPINIAVVGEVNRPGPYALEVKAGLPTITQALQTAGGINQMANVRKIEVRRPTRAGTNQTIPIDLWKLLKEGDLSQDLVLQQGDTIAIPTATALDPTEASKLGAASFSPGTMNVNIVGEVTRPGTVQVAANTPLNQAILAAGGFNKDAKKKSVELIRLNPNGTVARREITIDLARGIDENGNPVLQNGDVVVVEKSGAAKFSQTLETVLGPVGRVLPFRFLFGL